MDDAMISIKISQITEVKPIVVVDAEPFAHGEIADKPIPVPRARSASDKAAATNAPAITAPQVTPAMFASLVTGISVNKVCSTGAVPTDPTSENVARPISIPPFFDLSQHEEASE
jgi:hypothetical protein